MLIDHWPLLGLRLITPRLELRLPAGEELGDLAGLGATDAVSGAFDDNISSLRVSAACGSSQMRATPELSLPSDEFRTTRSQ
jgi:hypothetical protein